jgi:molecular chaperone HtpG
LNRHHPLIHNLSTMLEQEPEVVDEVIEQLYENALLVDGIHPNPADMVPRIQKLLEMATRRS